jgi:hypothetical protein
METPLGTNPLHPNVVSSPVVRLYEDDAIRLGKKFHRLVVFRERPFRQFIERKQAPKPLLLHDKRPGAAPRRCVYTKMTPFA